jgi:predicted NAD/FAD-binding protein
VSLQSIGVVGSGIGGLAAAWLLDRRYAVTLLERNDYVGGHTNTWMVDHPGGAFPVDTGFMVFNDRNYPLLCGLFEHLGVSSYPTDMSFAASIDAGRVEYAGSDFGGLFGQRSNLWNPGFLRMLIDIVRFNRAAKAALERPQTAGLSLGDFLDRGHYGARFADHYLLPMAAAIWSCPTAQMRAFPFLSFARFFNNHGLLDLADRPQWRTVSGGSQSYVQCMLAQMRADVRTNAEVRRLRRTGGAVEVETRAGERLTFDAVVLGCHGDEALAMIADPTPLESELLGGFRTQPNRVYLHRDPALMPRRRRVWSSWNYLGGASADPGTVTLTYWMNSLQDLPKDDDVFVSLNPAQPPRAELVIAQMDYRHPVFDATAVAAQGRIGEIQGQSGLWFSGAWLGYGFHEDGLRAAVAVAAALGVPLPWGDAGAPSGAVHS